jgi:hypothetical protein
LLGNHVVSAVVGSLIGIISGVVLILILKDAVIRAPHARLSLWERAFGRRQASGVRLSVKVASIPALWAGTSYSTRWHFGPFAWAELSEVYWLCLGVFFLVVIAYPVIRLIIKIGSDLQ